MTSQRTKVLFLPAILALLLINGSCSINRIATRAIADALSSSGSNSFAQDDDLILVGEALPFALKMYETILESAPDHRALNVTTGSICVMYANAFIEHPARLLVDDNPKASREGLARAKKFYLRGLSYLERAAELRMKGWQEVKADEDSRTRALGRLGKEDMDLLYWYAASLLSAWAIDPMDMGLALRIGEARSMLDRAEAIDSGYGDGALHEVLLILYAALPEELGGSEEKALYHFESAIESSKGLSAGAYVQLASGLMVQKQDYPRFKELLEKALSVDSEANPPTRLMTILSQERARFLLGRAEMLFWDLGDSDDWELYDDE